jgi:putative heme-binding domain-containing protein
MTLYTRNKPSCLLFVFFAFFAAKKPPRLFLCLLCLFVVPLPFASTAHAQRDLKEIPSVDPEIERATFKLPPGFEVNLFAADPLLAKPIQMNWDTQGRLWVATSETYPQVEPGKPANDKVIILSDENHDGVADKMTVFADKLLIPTGVLPGDGGAYVANSTELLHLKDTDGDGRADQRKIVLSGFGTEDTHHIIHTFRWSPRGTMFFAQSIYIHSHVETPYGVKRLMAGGFWEYDPRTQKLGVFATGLVNAWGIAWDKQGNMFATDGAGNEGINFVFPGSVMTTAYEAERVVKGLNPGSPKHCGLEIIESEHFPQEWQGHLITCDFRAHRVCRFALSDDGSGFASKEMPEVIKSTHPAFRPIDVKIGPDGALYIADWYNPIIQHGEVDFRDPRRDKTHGRIWRVTCKDRKLVKAPDLEKLEAKDLVKELVSPNLYTKEKAREIYRDRFASTKLLDKSVHEIADENEDIGLEVFSLKTQDEIRLRISKAEDSQRVMKLFNSFTCLGEEEQQTNKMGVPSAADVFRKYTYQLNPNPRVRLAAINLFRQVDLDKDQHSKSLKQIAGYIDHPMDRFLDFALWKTLREMSHAWLAELEAGINPFEKPSHLIYALNCVPADKAAPAIRAVLEKKLVPESELPKFTELLYARGNVNDLAAEIDKTDWAAEKPAAIVKRLELMQKVATKAPTAPKNAAKLVPLVKHDDPAVRAAAYRLVGQWRGSDVFETLRDSVADAKAPLELRLAAANGLIHNPAATPLLRELAEKNETPAALRVEVAILLTPRDVNSGAGLIAKLLNDEIAASALAPHWTALLGVKNASGELAKSLKDVKLPPEAARIALRAIKRLPKPDANLLGALGRAGGISGGPRVWTDAEKQAILTSVSSKGDAARGEAIYRRAELNCLKCHAIGGAGGVVGPDIRSLGASSPVDYILDSLLEPSKKIKENYNATVVETDQGVTLNGIKIRESEAELVLRNQDDKEIVIPKKSIDSRADSTISLMPGSLVDDLSLQELIDLVRFLSELGKEGPYAVGQQSYARVWQTPVPNAENHTLLNRQGTPIVLNQAGPLTWTSAYSKVNGELPVEGLTQQRFGGNAQLVGFARAKFTVSTAGELGLKFNNTKGLAVWVDQEGQIPKDVIEVDLPAGEHTVMITVEMTERTEPLCVELIELKGSNAKAQWASGK